jgi:allantoicase
MDGWESRRRREPGNDWCVVSLAFPGTIHAIDLDTRHFTGNYPPHASVLASNSPDPLAAAAEWTEILAPSALAGNSHNLFAVSDRRAWRHLKLQILPDGGIARLRVYGRVAPDWSAPGDGPIDLFAIANGGIALECNNQHYGDIRRLNAPGRGRNMSDGWETRRRREPGFDWAILQLGHPGIIEAIELDTAHFRGNYPHQVSLHAAALGATTQGSLAALSMHWPLLLAPQSMRPDAVHRFETELERPGVVSHVRVNLHPDGGLSRVRLYGRLARG